MKKFLIVLLIFLCLPSLCGCSIIDLGKNPISIEDIDWKVENGVIDGENALIFTYTNNSNYVIMDVEMIFRQKENTADEDLKIFDDLKETYSWTDEEVKEVYILGYNRKFAETGETVSESPCVINGTHILADQMEEYELMEPSEVSIAYIGDDNNGHILNYDFTTGVYEVLYQDGVTLKEWPENEFTSLVPEPSVRAVTARSNIEGQFSFDAYETSAEYFNSYVNSCKNVGFTNVQFESESKRYRATNADGYEVPIIYTKSEETMSVRVISPEENG